MYRIYSFLTLLLIGLFVFPSVITAAEPCLPIFNGGKACTTSKNLTITKQVKNPQTNQYVSSLSSQGPFFSPAQTIQFRVTVQNTSKSTIKDIRIVDTFPTYITYQSGTGKFDMRKHTLTTNIDELAANSMHSYEISAKVASISDLQKLSGNMNCFINQVTASSRGNTAQTNTQYCINKKQQLPTITATPTPQSTGFTNTRSVTPTPINSQTNNGKIVYAPSNTLQTPKTGGGLLTLVLIIPTSLVGFYLQKRSV